MAYNAAGNSPASNIVTILPALAAPTGLAGTVSPQAPLSVTLTWLDNSTIETGFTIQRSTSANFTGATTFTAAANAITFTDNSAVVNNTYYYRVRATTGAVNSGWSNTATVQTRPPTAPSGLSATAITRTTLTLNWTDNSNNEGGFTIQRATNPTFNNGLQTFTAGANVTTFNDSGLIRNTRYYYRVNATNAAGSSAWSPSINVLTLP